MKKKPEDKMTYEAAFAYYFGIQTLAKQPLPFTCRCGLNYYFVTKKDEFLEKVKVQVPMMQVQDCFRHIRSVHREGLKK